MIWSVILVFISIIFFIIGIYCITHTKKINTEIGNKNTELIGTQQILQNNINELKEEVSSLDNKKTSLNIEQQVLNNDIESKKRELDNIQSTITSSTKAKEELSQKAFENYCEVLDKQYKEAEDEYATHKEAMETAYSNLQLELIQKMDAAKEELAQIEATRAAAIQAQLKEKEIEEKSTFYCLQISDADLKDVSVLESIKPKLNNKRILSMLIWQTYFRTPMTSLCNNIIGKEIKTGIYKITNQKTKECYIGQAVDLATRWKNHAKCGLGIDTPAGNKLYKAMQDYGIWNFSWEVLELCSKDQLDEKEQYYIKLYQAKEYGYNSKKI